MAFLQSDPIVDLPPKNASVVDVHTHVYLPKYMDILRNRYCGLPHKNTFFYHRTQVPKIIKVANQERLVILPEEEDTESTSVGRPIGYEYWSISKKIDFMNRHGITTSINSLANPWLGEFGCLLYHRF